MNRRRIFRFLAAIPAALAGIGLSSGAAKASAAGRDVNGAFRPVTPQPLRLLALRMMEIHRLQARVDDIEERCARIDAEYPDRFQPPACDLDVKRQLEWMRRTDRLWQEAEIERSLIERLARLPLNADPAEMVRIVGIDGGGADGCFGVVGYELHELPPGSFKSALDARAKNLGQGPSI